MGVCTRNITLDQIRPNCELLINEPLYHLANLVNGKKVLDIGCGYGRNRIVVNEAGGFWTGIDPFPEKGSNDIIEAYAENLPIQSESVDVVIMDAVLEHVKDPSICFKEIARVLKPNGIFIGYVAFMECFHEISYCHLSFKALEYFSENNGMKLKKISGGSSFGIDYHLQVLLYPLPFSFVLRVIPRLIRGWIRLKSKLSYLILRHKRKMNKSDAMNKAKLYYQIECLRQSVGYSFIIQKQNTI